MTLQIGGKTSIQPPPGDRNGALNVGVPALTFGSLSGPKTSARFLECRVIYRAPLVFLFGRIFCDEPMSTSSENALARLSHEGTAVIALARDRPARREAKSVALR